MTADIVNTRSGDRFTVIAPVNGSFTSSDVTIADISVAGLGIVHSQPLRIGTRGRMSFTFEDIAVAVQARLIWSHLSQRPDSSGKLLYVSGLHVESADPQFATAINALFRLGAIRQDSESMERKRARIQEREEARRAQMKRMPPTSGGI